MDRIVPFLWFDNQAEEAANYYVSVFKNSRIKQVTRRPEGTPGPAGSVMVVSFELEGREFLALNGGPHFKFNEAISLVVNCETQHEIDAYWEKLSEGGEQVQCGWLKDRYGLSWQIVPSAIGRLMSDPNKAKPVAAAMMKMVKLNIAELERAADETAA